MAFNSIISRNDAQALIPEEVTADIIQNAPQNSAVLQLGRRLPNMPTNQTRMPILSSLATAYFLTGDTDQKRTTQMAWESRFINAEELAVIVPIPENVLDDASYDVWAEVRPRIEEAMGVAFDQAVFYGTNAPNNWPDDLLTGATNAGQTVARGAIGDLYDDIFSENGILNLVEEDGYLVTGHVGALTMRAGLRGIRDAGGYPLFNRTMKDDTRYDLDGSEVVFPLNGAVDPAQSLLISGDWNQLVYSIRKDITYRVLDQATIHDAAGNVVFNFAQQDMVGLRATFRLGWELPNPINRVNENAATRYPFAILTP